jgi:asparagine synthase (glutamine-hydrolysing)
MCGIVGCVGTFSRERLEQASCAIEHRGPDDSGIHWQGDGAGLAFRRLAIIDLSPTGAQPMASHDGRYIIVFNGEIYNFRELRARLAADGVGFRGTSDTEVLLELYVRQGERMLTQLNGIFALAIWDRSEKRLFVARDGFGVKPLYYSMGPAGFAFASEIKALMPLIPEAAQLDPVALHRYLMFLWCPGEQTPLKQVKKLGPGEALVATAAGIERRWIWYVPPPFTVAEARTATAQSLIHETAARLRTAVHRQLVSDVPVGAFLSGGLDSSSVVAFAREEVSDLRCFTIESLGELDRGATDDLPYARAVARHLKVPLDIVPVDATDMAHDLERMVFQLDEPLADPAPLNVLYISELARRHGIKVLLSGAGGDDVFSGYRRHVALGFERIWKWLPMAGRNALDDLGGKLDQQSAVARRLGKLLNGANLEGDPRIANYFRWIRESELLALYSPGFRAAAATEAVDQPLLDYLAELPPGTGMLNRMLALEQRFFLGDHNLIYTDKMSMAASVEVRVPFLDPELVEFASAIPERFKQHGRQSKWVLKRAMEPYLPREVIYRPKSGFGAPLRRWMRRELRPLLGDLLSEESLRKRGLFDPAAVHRLMERNDAGRIDASYMLLALLSVEIWCRRFVDAPLPATSVTPLVGAHTVRTSDPEGFGITREARRIRAKATATYQVCSNCVMDTTDPKIVFDAQGRCDHCNTFALRIEPHWHTDERGAADLQRLVKRVRDKGRNRDFDCVIGLSGGVDSSYLTYLAKEEFGLRPLVFHVDTGWNSQEAVNNVERLVDGLGLELFTEVVNWREMRDLQLSYFKAGVPHVDVPQDHAIFAAMYRYASQHDIKYILTGANYATECVRNPVDWMYYQSDATQLRDIHDRYGTEPLETFPTTDILWHKVYLPWVKGIRVERPLNFVPYRKQEALEELSRRYGWLPYPQKHFESRFTAFYEGFWLYRRFGFDVRRVQFSSLILTNQMTRADAIEALESPPLDEQAAAREFAYVASKLEISPQELTSYLYAPSRTYKDFKSRAGLYTIGATVAKALGLERGGKR